MKWFKHISDSIHDPFIFSLMEEFGGDGYLVFFGVLEIYSREFRTESDWKLTEKLSYFRHNLLISSSKFKKILSKITKWEVGYQDDTVSIFIPKYKELLDESTLKKLREHEKSSGIVPEWFRKAEAQTKTKTKTKTKIEEEREEEAPPFPREEKEKVVLKKRGAIPPEMSEVQEYCTERKNGIDPEAWMAFYASKGWMVGKSKMVDWRSAIITWEKRGGNGRGNSPERMESI